LVVRQLPGYRITRRGLSGSRRATGLALALAAAALAMTATPGSASRTASRAGSAPAILITTYRLTPKVQHTVRFTGYATYSFQTRPKRRIMSATARIVGAQPGSVKIETTGISHRRKRFTVKLIFPGEQGNPGKLVVRLSTVGI
jgi:hypothetical protein